ncbi:winged helix-turn-helix domain-containing protein [Halocynthiibacter sp. C4]|uniref:winged helix-turn-helix domain-containing protein n=1 Tax=Halocynthiibacter sp. C4 TaxID=2992758 RepID=UPI00237BF937|nr:winged helix-turn-helix domain-containing protein [Halocynthiibacter sp. C4]MDE0590431.1 winged helix-turn-helix domain-containing protein [Halocynthiibacter sp. C4]
MSKLEYIIENAFRMEAHTSTLFEAEIGARMKKSAPKRPRSWYPKIVGDQKPSAARIQILDVLKRDGRATVRSIANQIDMDPRGVSGHISRMIDAGLVEQEGVKSKGFAVDTRLYRAVRR